MTKTAKISVVIIIIVIIVALSVSSKPKQIEGELNIGVISALTGNAAYIGESNKRGTEIAKIKILEDNPGLAVNLFHEDSFLTPKGGIDAYNKLRASNKINALITMASNVSVAVEPLAIRDNVLFVAASTLATAFSTPDDLTYRLTTTADLEAAPAIEYLDNRNLSKLGIIYMTNEIGVSLFNSLKKVAQDSTVKIVSEEGYAPESTDFKTILSKMKNLGVDSIYIAGLAPHSSVILKQASELKIDVPFLTYRAAEDPVLIKNAGPLAEKIVYTNAYDVYNNDSLNKEFVTLYKEKYNEDPNGYAAESYEATRLIADIFVKCGSTTASQEAIECSKKFLSSVKNVPSLFGPLSFDGNGDVSYPFFMKTVRDGKFVRLEE